tara:strand:+ start:360 stop:539 length:180 start_codon:yes stop_codon:yes gene_type:complete
MGKLYKLTRDAENDLREVARYTLSSWGASTLKTYRKGLVKTFYECFYEKGRDLVGGSGY